MTNCAPQDRRVTTPPDYTRWQPFNERFWGRVEKTDTCWLWTGKLSEKGYSTWVSRDGEKHRAHQWSYLLHVGPLVDGLVVDHLCRVRHCVNPDHLEQVTAIENTERGVASRWSEPCSNGHSPEHRKALPSGRNICLECRRESDRRRHEQHRDERLRQARERYAAKARPDRRAA